MARGIIKRLLGGLRETAARLPDNRKSSNARKYSIKDAVDEDYDNLTNINLFFPFA